MVAKIVSKKREYYSRVFAIFNPGWHQCVIVFDDENQTFELCEVYDRIPFLERKVFITDTDQSHMIEKEEIKLSWNTVYKKCLGYDWILNNPDFIRQIKEGEDVDPQYLQMAREANRTIDKNEWHTVKKQKDADDLISAAWGFHDAILEHISYRATDPSKEAYDAPSRTQVLFTACWNCDILLEFCGDVLIHFGVDDHTMPQIMDCNILFCDGFVYWVDDSCVKNVTDITNEHTYFRARSLKWKMITKTMPDC